MVQCGEHTIDQVKRYGLEIIQPAGGYRFSLDALLLADFVMAAEDAGMVDLGTGGGIIPLLLCRRYQSATVVGIENNSTMAELARENVARNGLADRVRIVTADVADTRSHFPVSTFDGVVSNPPYRTPVSGRISPKAGRDTARHESSAGLVDFLAAAKYLVKPSGRIWFIYNPDRMAEFIACASEQKLALLRLRMVHGRLDAPARMFMAELAKGRKGETAVLPPLIIYADNGDYTREAQSILADQTGT